MVESAARRRFVTEAARLFASRGYARTSVADVQVACGLTPGSGALYKHFTSKADLLAAVIDTHVATMRSGHRRFVADLPADPAAALHAAAQAVVDGIGRDRHAVRVLLRDLDDFPDLRERMWAEVRAHVYAPFAAWLADLAARGEIRVRDPEATGAMLMASLTGAQFLESLIGHAPGDVAADRFVAAWVDGALAVLGVDRAG